MYTGAWEEARKIRALAGDQSDIDIDMDAGLEVPNPYYNDWLDDLYGALPFRNSYKSQSQSGVGIRAEPPGARSV